MCVVMSLSVLSESFVESTFPLVVTVRKKEVCDMTLSVRVYVDSTKASKHEPKPHEENTDTTNLESEVMNDFTAQSCVR
jgi:hypothetical protein